MVGYQRMLGSLVSKIYNLFRHLPLTFKKISLWMSIYLYISHADWSDQNLKVF